MPIMIKKSLVKKVIHLINLGTNYAKRQISFKINKGIGIFHE